MCKTKLLKLIATTLIISTYASADCEEKFYAYAGDQTLPNKQATVFPILNPSFDKKHNIETNKEMAALKEHGIEKYIDLVMNGSASGHFESDLFNFNIFDLALTKKTKQEKIDLLILNGFQPSSWGMKYLFSNYSIQAIIDLINKTNVDLNSVTFDGKYSTANFLLLNNKLDLLRALEESGYLNTTSNFYQNTLIDINRLPIEKLPMVSSFLDINQYRKNQQQQVKTLQTAQNEKDKFLEDYRHVKLVSLCTDNFNSINKNDVLFTYSVSEISEVLQKNKASISAPMKKITKAISDPIMQDNIATLKEHNYLSKQEIKRIEDFSTLPLTKNNDTLYINRKLQTLEEHLFLTNKISWAEGDPRMRLHSLSKELSSSNSKELRKLLQASKELKSAYYLGKNFSYYATISIDDLQLLNWVYKVFGPPNVKYGVNIIDRLYMIYFYSESAKQKIQLIQKNYPNFHPSESFTNLFKKHSKITLMEKAS